MLVERLVRVEVGGFLLPEMLKGPILQQSRSWQATSLIFGQLQVGQVTPSLLTVRFLPKDRNDIPFPQAQFVGASAFEGI